MTLSAHWRQSRIGGGGFITGLLTDPFDPDRLYARSDVAGSFVSEDGGRSWQARNNGLSRQHHHQVAALVPSPHQPGLVLRCSGDNRDGRCFGSIHRSTDHGQTWREIEASADYYGNGPLRAYGEVLSFDPADSERVMTVGYSSGIHGSDDAGLSFQSITGEGLRFSVIRHHPTVAGLVYAATAGDVMLTGPYSPTLTVDEQIREHGDERRGCDGQLFRSRDGGRQWESVAALPASGFTSLEFGENPELVLASTADGLWVSSDAGENFSRSTTGLPETAGPLQFDIVRRDPRRPGRYLAATYLGPDPFPLYESLDGGSSWHLLRAPGAVQLRNYPPYVDSVARLGEMLPTVEFSPRDPQTFFITGFWGVSVTHDNGESFDGQHFHGLETTCVESVVADPHCGQTVFVTVADHSPWVSRDGGQTFSPFPPARQQSTGLAVSPHRPQLVVYAHSSLRWNAEPAELFRSTDGGATGELVHRFDGRLFVNSIAADPHHPERFWILLDGDVPTSADADRPGLYRLDGKELCWFGFPVSATEHLPLAEDWLESQLLPVVVYQKRNAAGCNHLVCADPWVPDRLYLAEPTTGLWRSDDGCGTWSSIADGLPLGRRRVSTLVHLQCDPSHPGRVYAGFVGEGLWRSDNAGGTWMDVLTPERTGEEYVNATGLAIRRDGVLAVPGEPMWWTDTETRLRVSLDDGLTWTDVTNPALGGIRLKQAVFDGSGRLHVTTIGNGMFTVDLDGIPRAQEAPQ